MSSAECREIAAVIRHLSGRLENLERRLGLVAAQDGTNTPGNCDTNALASE
jgi:hypothetical protein